MQAMSMQKSYRSLITDAFKAFTADVNPEGGSVS
jgi:hypothetical protein